MSEWKQMTKAHHEARDDLSVEPDIRNGAKAKPKKSDKPWAFCVQYQNWFGNKPWKRYYKTRELAEVQMAKFERENKGWHFAKRVAWIEHEGEKV